MDYCFLIRKFSEIVLTCTSLVVITTVFTQLILMRKEKLKSTVIRLVRMSHIFLKDTSRIYAIFIMSVIRQKYESTLFLLIFART